MTSKENFGEYLRRLRTERNYTLTQMGARLNIDSGALSKIETGKKRLDEKCLPSIAEIFNLDIRTLKDEFFSEVIAYKILENECSDKIWLLAVEKVKYIKNKKLKQGEIDFPENN